jgi:hypothetical protein
MTVVALDDCTTHVTVAPEAMATKRFEENALRIERIFSPAA